MKKESATKTSFDQKFWARFAKSAWERKTLVLKQVESSIQKIDETEIFNLLIKYADACRKNSFADGFKFFIEGERVYENDVLQVLPVKSDKSLLGYHERMNKNFSDYCLVCDELLRVNHEKQSALLEFTQGLYEQIGLPNRFSEMGLYLGNYKKTPFGVHVDGCGVFSFPVVGNKKFRIWTSDFVKKNPDLDRSFEYSKYKKYSELLVAGPGDMTYWPSSAWHIAESDGSFTATWSLGVWVDRPHQDVVAETMNRLFTAKLGASSQLMTTRYKKLQTAQGEIQNLPQLYRDSVSLLKTISKEEIQNEFLKTWLIQTSKQGFKTPPQTNVIIKPNATLRLQSTDAPIFWFESNVDKKIYCCFAGVLTERSTSKSFLKLIKALNTGQSCKLMDFLKASAHREDLQTLQFLASAGAFAK